MKKQSILFALLATIAAPVFADGFYAGADLGRSKLEADIDDHYSLSATDTTWSVFGGYDFNQYLAAEVGYRGLGSSSETDTISGVKYDATLKARALQFSVLGKLPVNDRFDVFARLGLASIRAELDAKVGNRTVTHHETETKPLIGLGARFAVTKNVGLRAEWTRFAKLEDAKLSTLTFGADIRF
ncbi:outer membrane beta-barrel protein [Parachitinimonas caeni]|uniref:Outer membrane beta-barrel protein n=1 Tax=Parachitinimonas caeni TaxID=3031301 RepID=A0ABT7DYD9_9NEIS|nr:outer membrane beta-barrel protein [Parachitinimonas caeni]MDK2124103.1 outer membrane beta-barrel protein [Parachitinimonas caeni]